MPSKGELKSLGERRNYQDRELDARAVSSLSSDEYLWFQAFFPARLEHAAQIESNKRQNAERMPVWNTRRMWEGKATPEEDEKARAAGDHFATRFPQFDRNLENAQAMVSYMQAHDLDATKVESYVSAYKALVEDGKLTPAPAQSANDFLRSHIELHDKRIPPIIQARNAKAQATAEHFQRARAATAQAGATSVTDYPADETGYPNYPTKYSFRRLVESLDAESYARRLKEDPQFSAALDRLNDGNK